MHVPCSRRSFLAFSACGLLSVPRWQPAFAAGKTARAKSVLVLFEQGGVSHMDTFDYKPKLQQMFGEDLPASIRQGQRLTGMTADQKKRA